MPLTLFLVEDNPVILDRLWTTLEDLAPVRVVGSCADQLSAMRWLGEAGHHCDLLVIDLFLKAGSGIGLLDSLGKAARTLRADAPPATRCVVLTNYSTPALRARCLALGADRVFDKSQDIDALVDYCTGLAGAGGAAPAVG